MTEAINLTSIKIALLGDSTVGKTAICNSFLKIEFTADMLSTIGQEKIEKKYELKNGKEIKLVIWDTAGQERFHSIAIKALKSAQGVIIVYDVTKKETFEHVNNWLETIKEEMTEPNLILFGNKIDLENRQVSKEEAEKYANKNNLKYFETSAKLSKGIDEGFDYIINDSYKKAEEKANKNIVIGKNNNKKEEKGGCFGKKKKSKQSAK